MPKYRPHSISMAEPQENFAEYYSFDKKNKLSPRETLNGVSKWEKKWRSEGSDTMRPKEDAYLKGKPSHYGHSIGQRQGKLRTSGKGHRIGKR